MNFAEARKQNIRYVRKSYWADPDAVIDLGEKLKGGGYGPWVKLHAPNGIFNTLKHAKDLCKDFLPQSIIFFQAGHEETDWEEYKGTMIDSLEYQNAIEEIKNL